MPQTPDPDQALVTQAQAAPDGDTRAFEALVDRHQELVTTNCRFITRSADDAEDLAQEVFVKAYFAMGRFEGRSSFKSWIQRIKVNHCLNFLRARKDQTTVDATDEVYAGEPELQVAPRAERQLERDDERARIAAALDSLSENLRVALVLRDLDGLAYEEVAERLGIGLSATKMRIKRAREEFRARYQEIARAQEPAQEAS